LKWEKKVGQKVTSGFIEGGRNEKVSNVIVLVLKASS
jgi:hypothetical protein